MPLSITGFDANGRIIPKGEDVVIPPESAGIGDLIYKASATDFIVIGRGTNSTASILKNNKTYQLYAGIYGFVSGMAMICAPSETSKTWTSGSPTIPSSLPTYGEGSVLMRNGIKCTYAQMNTAQQMASDTYRGTAGTNVHPTAAYNGGVMTKATFESTSGAEARRIYGTWEEYLRQTLRVNGAPGTPFGAVASGVKVHEFGRWATKVLHGASATAFPAANYCATYKGVFDAAEGNWWLPSMFELGEMLIDAHWDKLNDSNKNGFSVPGKSSYRWSCVLYSSTAAWYYDDCGVSGSAGFPYDFAVRPVSLFKLK